MTSFFQSGDTSRTDQAYRALRDVDDRWTRMARTRVEAEWPRVAAFLDRDFPTKAAQDLFAHYWEFYLTLACLEAGIALVPRAARGGRDDGPDVLAVDGWAMEAVAAKAGNGPDAVTPGEDGVARQVPDIDISLRLVNAFTEKLRVLRRYVAKGVVRADAPFVIAINGAGIPSARQELLLPRIVMILFGVGAPVVTVNRVTMQMGPLEHESRIHLTKRSGAQVATDLFLQPDFAPDVSAVVYAPSDPWNRSDRAGEDMIAVHNPHATVPIAPGSLPVAAEFWYKEHTVERTVGRLERTDTMHT